MNFDGLHAKRLNEFNPREVIFARAWKEENRRTDIVGCLMECYCEKDTPGARPIFGIKGYFTRPLGETTDRDRIIASTVVQWLGTNCGFLFVQDALRECGYDIVQRK